MVFIYEFQALKVFDLLHEASLKRVSCKKERKINEHKTLNFESFVFIANHQIHVFFKKKIIIINE